MFSTILKKKHVHQATYYTLCVRETTFNAITMTEINAVASSGIFIIIV